MAEGREYIAKLLDGFLCDFAPLRAIKFSRKGAKAQRKA
jgi:hypothetical protein